MHGESFFVQAFMYLMAAVVGVPLAKRAGLGSVLGYLLAGVMIGPFVLGLVGAEGQDVMHFAEFGVVMMLFLVGLELEPALLWRMRAPILGLGGLQVAGTSLLLSGVGLAVGLSWQVALAVGMILSLSSTAIVLQTLNEKGLMKTAGGQSSFAVLLFQDIAVIPMLALMPLLATFPKPRAEHGGEHHSGWLDSLPAWGSALAVLAALVGLIFVGRFLLRPAFRFIARARLPEAFTAASLLLVIGIALLMTKLGVSPALGTFVAGVVLATSEYRHELESDIEPFKGLLLGLFFISVGAAIDFSVVANEPGTIGALVVGLMALKFLVLWVLGRVFRLGTDQGLLLSFGLAQGGEFAFVLFSYATQNGVVPLSISSPLIASVALSMALTPLVMLVNEKLVTPRFGTKEQEERAEDVMDEENPVIVAGFGRFGQIVARLLRTAGYPATLLDIDSDQVDLVRRFGNRVYYGDASRHDLLRSAGAERARLIVIAVDNPEKALEMVHTIRKHFPHVEIIARAQGRQDAYELVDAGVRYIFRETFDSSLAAGEQALRALGMRAYQAGRVARSFRRHDESAVRDMAAERHDEANFTNKVRARIASLEEVLRSEQGWQDEQAEQAWDRPGARKSS